MPESRPSDPDVPLIRRKLTIPSAPERLVVRERIDCLIAELIGANPVVWVCATAGSGKTTAVAQALRGVRRPVAWLTLDETDAAPGRLVTYLDAAIGSHVPSARSVGTSALAARLPHTEAAGLLSEAVGQAPLLLVIDELERIARAPTALSVIATLVRYAPQTMRIVLISRVELGIALDSVDLGRAVTISESDLAFTTSEAAAALASAGAADIDPSVAVEVTGGWVAGILFEAWRSNQHVAGMGGEADALHGYLSTQILDQLSPADREFLITTSVLDDVTAARAAALGELDGAARLASLRQRHLPAAWREEGRSLRCHARLREYLLERLERRGTDEVQRVRAAHAELLLREGHHEDAVEEFLRAGLRERAVGPAETALARVIDRLDYPVAERWLSELSGLPGADSGKLAIGEMMLALGREDYARGGRVADRLHMVSERQRLARESPGAAGMMAWSYWHLGRWRDAAEVGWAAADGPEREAVRFALNLVDRDLAGGDRPIDPPLTGSPLDAMVIRVLYAHGHFRTLSAVRSSGWTAAVTEPWRIGLLRATGHPEQALELYERTRVADWAQVWLHAMVGPEILIDLRRPQQARAAVKRGRELTRASGSLVFVMLNELIEAKMEIRLNRDPPAALAVLDRLEDRQAASDYRFIGEAADVWRGLSLLALGENDRALAHLEHAVATMTASDRILELPSAGVYLSEARWRAGDEDGADAAADIAYEAARRQGSNHYLLQALASFPAVVARRLDAEARADSPWHELGRALRAQDVAVNLRLAARVELVEFGEPAILVDGVPTPRPRIAKSYELLAFLISCPSREASRETLLEVLFDGRSDDSARAYLRQALHQLREVLPSDVKLVSDAHRTGLDDGVLACSESSRLESLLAEAARLQGEERIDATLRAIECAGRGQYLEGLSSIWIEERRERLARLILDARHDAAELSFAIGRYADAARLVEATLTDDPFREATHRLEMRIANATGDEDRVIAAYRRCERRLGELGTAPSTSTRQLLETLRR